ncbi:MAG: putative lipid II flippase FtsW, partial [Gammaproteobacteria bacterium]
MEASLHQQAVPQSDSSQLPAPNDYDLWLIGGTATLLCVGLIMVVSTSVSIAERRELDPLFYFWRQLIGAGLGLVSAAVIMFFPLRYFERASTSLLFVAMALLVAVLVPGVGREVNGSMRWIAIGPATLQASEVAKMAVVIYLAAYLVRHNQQVRTSFLGFIKPIGVLTVIGALFVVEPDFGAAVVLFATGLGMLFLAGVPMLRFFFWGLTALTAVAALSMLAPYRLERLMTFMDPWSDPFNSGFQLTQALIAFGRGEWLGVGLGNSVQKLFYLPEVHTDFAFAVIGEEVGLIGSLGVIALFVFLVWRIFYLGGAAERANQLFAAYVTYGIGLLIGIQAFVNIGVNLGLLPTKGLPLPFLSYASNNLVMTCAAIGIALRAGYEARS